MSDQDRRGRGRGRGRARGGPGQQQGQQMRNPGDNREQQDFNRPRQGQSRPAPVGNSQSYPSLQSQQQGSTDAAPAGAWAARNPQQPWGAPAQLPPQQPAPGLRPTGRGSGQPRGPPGLSAPLSHDPRHSAAISAAPRQAAPVGTAPRQQAPVGVAPGDGTVVAESAGRGSMRGRRICTGTGIEKTLITRPHNVLSKKGISGTKIKLSANYFPLESHTEWCLYQYRVDFSPDDDRTYVKKSFLRNHDASIGVNLFDGSVMYTAHRLPKEVTEFSSTRNKDQLQVLITIKFVGQIGMGDHQYIQFFNTLLRACYKGLNLQLVGRDYFDAEAKVEIREHNLQLWPGYKTSIRQHENSILMCAEVTHKVMRMDSALDILIECTKSSGRGFREEFEKRIIGCVVLTEYNNNKTYNVHSVEWNKSPKQTFPKKDGTEISYLQYYEQKYGIRIRDPNQPLLIHRAKERDVRAGHSEICCLIPELCRTTGLTENMRNNFHLMRALAEHTRVNPELRIRKLQDFNQRLRTSPQSVEALKNWQMELSAKIIQFSGRLLQPEKIILGRQKKVDVNSDVDWTRDLRSNPMLSVINIPVWTVLVPGRLRRDASEFVRTLQKASYSMQLAIAEPSWVEIPDDRNGSYTDSLEKIISTQGSAGIVMCVVPNNRGDRYAAIKKKTCVDRSMPTQVILAKNLNSKGVMSIATKVAIQMNCKVGGAPWSVEIPITKLMVIGYDVCHDTSNRSMSYGAFVASLDQSLSKYFSAVSHHPKGEELANDMVIHVQKALHAFKNANGTLPQRIIFYRDGVGDGQIDHVHATEVERVREMIASHYPPDNPCKLAYIIVSKRINTRIFTDQGKNPLPGTVVDDVITLPERYDFFLVSQTVRQGTVSPTSYNVIHDTLGLDPDKIQRLTYKMTHMYYNWSGTCRVPAPCQYAHKLAFLVGQSLHRAPNSNMENSLYFL